MYDKLTTKVNNIDTSRFLLKTKYNTYKLKLEEKILDVSNLVKKSDYNTIFSEIEGKIPSITGLGTTSALTAVKNKNPSVSTLVKKTDYNTNISELEKKLTDHKHDKYIATPEFNKLTAVNRLTTENFAARLAKANLAAKIDFDNKLTTLNRKITSNKTNQLVTENELNKLETFDLGYFIGKNHFDEDGAQNYLTFQSMLEYFTLNNNKITKRKSKGLYNERLKVISTSDYTLTPSINYYGDKARSKSTGSVLQQKTIT